jgi:hypothetical protein
VIIEADLQRPRFDVAVPVQVRSAKAQVPFPDHAGPVACFLKDTGQGRTSRGEDEAGITGQNPGLPLWKVSVIFVLLFIALEIALLKLWK